MIQIQELKEIVVALSSRSVVSKIRLATNKPGQGSKTSEHPTSDHQDIDVELLILNHFFKAFVDVSPEELEVPKHVVQLVVDGIFRHMQNALKPSEPRVAGEGPLKSGSVEEQLKVLDPDEFDYMFPIEMPYGVSLDFSFCHQRAAFPKGSYGFGMIAVQTMPGDSQDRFLKSFVEGRFLQADKIKNWFKGWRAVPFVLHRDETRGGRRVGGVEYRSLDLRLHSHHSHGGAHTPAGDRHHCPSVRHRGSHSGANPPRVLHRAEKAVTRSSSIMMCSSQEEGLGQEDSGAEQCETQTTQNHCLNTTGPNSNGLAQHPENKHNSSAYTALGQLLT
ncbi:UNVERIFIED_CONTAM: hypothetical protein FKN15_061103 [Acipenser sinensis]